MEITKKNHVGLEIFSLIAAFLVVANHISPLAFINNDIDFLLTRVIARVAVPFFIIKTGFFLFKEGFEKERVIKYVIKILKIYLLAVIIYIPILLYQGYFSDLSILGLLKDFLFNGMFYHLWYFPNLIIGIGIVYFLLKKLNIKWVLSIAIILYLIGLFGDSYYGLIEGIKPLSIMYKGIFSVFDYTRNGLLMVPLFLVIGYLVRNKKINSKWIYVIGLFILMAIEAFALYKFNLQRHDSMYLLLPLLSLFIFSSLLKYKNDNRGQYQDLGLLIYIIHPFVLVALRFGSNVLNMKHILIDNGIICFILVSGISFVLGSIFLKIRNRFKLV